jgi:hypothetical protein
MITNCNNCAGPLNPTIDKCEYCGTYHREPTIILNNEHLLSNIGMILKDPIKMINLVYSPGDRDSFRPGSEDYKKARMLDILPYF